MSRAPFGRALIHATLALSLLVMALAALAPRAASSQERHVVYLPALRNAGAPPASPTPTPPAGSRPAVQVTHDAGRAVAAAIGPEGGTLEATAADGTRFTLTVPPAALDFSETITMTPALAVAGLPFSGGLAGAVSIEPAGLALYRPATLQIASPAQAPAPLSIGFAYHGAGERFHLYPLAPGAQLQQAAAPAITMEIISIRPVGAGRGSQEDLNPLTLDESLLSDPQDRLEEQAARDGDNLETYLDDYYVKHLLPDLYESDVSPAELDDALSFYSSWIYFVERGELTEYFASEIGTAKGLLTGSLRKLSAAAAERCYSEKRPEEGFRLLRWMGYAGDLLGGTEAMALATKLRACLTFEVRMRTWITEDAGHWGWRHELHAEPFKLRWSGGMRATGSGALSYDAVTWIGDEIVGCALSGSGAGSTIDAASGGYGLSILPVSRMNAAVKLHFSYDPGTPIETKSIVCDNAPGGSGQRQHWRDYYAQMHDYERSGSGFAAHATIVGAGSFEGWVYNHTGMGSQGPLQEQTEIEIRHTPER
jgi:hypothetical protein